MKFIVDNYERNNRTLESYIYKTFEIEGESKEDCFKKLYEHERSARYCSGTVYRFRDDKIQEEYKKWAQYGVTFEMYYGNGTVD